MRGSIIFGSTIVIGITLCMLLSFSSCAKKKIYINNEFEFVDDDELENEEDVPESQDVVAIKAPAKK